MKKILVFILPLLAFLGGAAGGAVLHQRSAPPSEEGGEQPPEVATASQEAGERAWFRFPNQFFVPLMRNSDIGGTMIVSLTIEMAKTDEEAAYAQEHRLRDALLRTLMIHANTGGFDGNFTADPQMNRLKSELVKTAKEISDGKVTDVLIEDIARQSP